jgi:hypothetical protein
VRLALDGNLAARATEIADGTTGSDDLMAVAEAFADRGRFFEAGAPPNAQAAGGRALPPASAPIDEARARVRRASCARRVALRTAGGAGEQATRPRRRGWRSGAC